jgi:hypothetical protein
MVHLTEVVRATLIAITGPATAKAAHVLVIMTVRVEVRTPTHGTLPTTPEAVARKIFRLQEEMDSITASAHQMNDWMWSQSYLGSRKS